MTELDDTKFCYQLIITLTKIVIYKALFNIKTEEIPRFFFISSEKKTPLSAHLMARTAQLLRHDAYCPFKSGQLITNQI